MVVQCTGWDDRVSVKGRQEERNRGMEGGREERREELKDGEGMREGSSSNCLSAVGSGRSF